MSTETAEKTLQFPTIDAGVRIGHVHLKVADLQRALDFYCGVLGCMVKHRLPQHAMAELSAGVTLVDTADPNGAWALEGANAGRNLDHFALLTNGWEEAEMRDWLAEHGVAIEEERAEPEETSFYGRDPSGNLVELLKRR